VLEIQDTTPAHLRVIERTHVHTLCGAALSDHDVAVGDATYIVAANCAVWPVCPTCRALYLERKEAH
jgi:hypothetical protein